MNTRHILAAVAAAVLLAGCGQNVGFLVRPVPLDQRLSETVIQRDAGWFVTDKIAIVDVDGILLNQRQMGFFSGGENPVSLFIEKFDKAQADEDVKAVVLRINSPGGGVTASDIMYHRLLRFRHARPTVPVIAVLEDVGASGAYYIACGANRIVAHPTSIVGSIGVIVQTFSLAGTMRMLGIDAKAVVSGPYKDMASPLAPLRDKDLAELQRLVDDHYEGFVKVVRKGRSSLSEQQVRQLADGRVWTGTEALANGLVDATGYMSDAISAAKAASGSRKARVVIYDRPFGYRANAYSQLPPTGASQINLLNVNLPDIMAASGPQFMYLWTTGLASD